MWCCPHIWNTGDPAADAEFTRMDAEMEALRNDIKALKAIIGHLEDRHKWIEDEAREMFEQG